MGGREVTVYRPAGAGVVSSSVSRVDCLPDQVGGQKVFERLRHLPSLLPGGLQDAGQHRPGLGALGAAAVAGDLAHPCSSTTPTLLRSPPSAPSSNNGSWTGPGITSSAAAATPNHAIAYATAADLGLSTFNAQPVNPTAILLKYTLAGNASLSLLALREAAFGTSYVSALNVALSPATPVSTFAVATPPPTSSTSTPATTSVLTSISKTKALAKKHLKHPVQNPKKPSPLPHKKIAKHAITTPNHNPAKTFSISLFGQGLITLDLN